MSNRSNELIPFVGSALAGLVVCLAITIATGKREAWDSGAYFSVGIPIMCMLIFALSYLFPARAWRWTVSMAVGQSIAMLLGGGSLSLWPLSIVAMAILSVPQLVIGSAASRLAKGGNSA
jgi:hypothetical protein